VVDFGLARTLEGNAGDTHAGAIIGTPLFLAPEAISKPDAVDGRSDLYALGAVAYFMLSGRDVFAGSTVVEVLGRHMLEEPVPPSKHLAAPLAADLEAVVLRCLAKDPKARPASATELRDALAACEDANRYDRRAAIEWWRGRGATLRSGRAAKSTASPATMAVALTDRPVARQAASPET
jgi:eukaryotic-like serine/threonine-protein kinase